MDKFGFRLRIQKNSTDRAGHIPCPMWIMSTFCDTCLTKLLVWISSHVTNLSNFQFFRISGFQILDRLDPAGFRICPELRYIPNRHPVSWSRIYIETIWLDANEPDWKSDEILLMRTRLQFDSTGQFSSAFGVSSVAGSCVASRCMNLNTPVASRRRR